MQIIGARVAAGLGAAFIMPATLSLLTAAYPPADRTKAVGIWAGVAGSGGALGMLVSGALLHFSSRQSIFWALSGAAVLLFVFMWTVSSSRVADAPPVDWPGVALIGAAVALFAYGILEAPARGWTNPVAYGSIAGGLVLAVLFGFVELRHENRCSTSGYSPMPASRPVRRPSSCSSPPISGCSTCSFNTSSWSRATPRSRRPLRSARSWWGSCPCRRCRSGTCRSWACERCCSPACC